MPLRSDVLVLMSQHHPSAVRLLAGSMNSLIFIHPLGILYYGIAYLSVWPSTYPSEDISFHMISQIVLQLSISNLVYSFLAGKARYDV